MDGTRAMDRASRQIAERRGRRAERIAVVWLNLAGWRVVARNLVTPHSEVDIVAVRGNVLAVVEVKARATLAAAEASLTYATRQRLERAAEHIRERSPYAVRPDGRERDVRVDALLVSGWRVRHVKGAWYGGD